MVFFTQYMTERTEGREGLVRFHLEWQQELEAANHVTAAARKQEEVHVGPALPMQGHCTLIGCVLPF